jgi:hypothetical protein
MPATNRLCSRRCISRITDLPEAGCGCGISPALISAIFAARASVDRHHSEWGFRNVIATGPAKVHLDVQFTRYRADNSVIGSFRSLWIVTRYGGHWAVAARSSFAD